MLKWLGMGCVLLGSSAVGFSLAQDLEERMQELRQLQHLMLLLKGQIRYVHQPLPDSFRQLSEQAESPFADFLAGVAQEMESRDGVSASKIWKRRLEMCEKELHLTNHEIRELEKLGEMLGVLDVEMQINTLDYYLEHLRLALEQAQEALRERKRLYQYMGVLGGIALCILIL